MTALAPENRTPTTSEGPKIDHQSDHRRGGDYRVSRWNALRWQLRREKIMVCTGRRCPYRFCELPDHLLPSVGMLCPWETEYAGQLADELRRLFEGSLLRSQLEEHKDLIREHVIASLLAGRASVRLSRAMEEVMTESLKQEKRVIDRKPFEHVALAMRYMTAAHNRTTAVWAEINELHDVETAKRREKRIRTAMIENGYWKPLKGEEPPCIEEAPEWIVAAVDRRNGHG